ncbi:uncharacterized protein LOC127689708 [Apodemus sylvaticus]|uniref:uncharacterized protein LOC127689708 n=1 Tax=Apodemus sylvaticus TaxID=10129 RepID=UPI002244465C|nr:uncharacterized protein LOC127689708 [Apodemus sylvaticus]
MTPKFFLAEVIIPGKQFTAALIMMTALMGKIIILNGSYSVPCDELVTAMKCSQQPKVKRKGNTPVGQVLSIHKEKSSMRSSGQFCHWCGWSLDSAEQPSDVSLCSQNHWVCQNTRDSLGRLCNTQSCELRGDNGSCSSVNLPPTAASSPPLIARNPASGLLVSALCSLFLPLGIGWGSLSAVHLPIHLSQALANLSSSINEDDFSPWEIAKLEECEPEASGGHLAFVEEKSVPVQSQDLEVWWRARANLLLDPWPSCSTSLSLCRAESWGPRGLRPGKGHRTQCDLRARTPECACAPARGSPGANLLPLILEGAGRSGHSAWSLAPGPSWAARGRTNSPGGGSARPSETALAPPEQPGLGLERREVGGRSTPAPPSGAWRVYEAPQGKVIGFRAPRCRERRKAAAEAAARGRRRARRGREGRRRRRALPRPGDPARAGRSGKRAAAGQGQHAGPRGPDCDCDVLTPSQSPPSLWSTPG